MNQQQNNKDNLGTRMKGYEQTQKFTLLRRTPVIIRADGKAFHTWTKNITGKEDPSLTKGPFSHLLHDAMIVATTFCMESMQNVQLAYTQSDEISFFLRDWDEHETQQWFGGNVQKIASVTASLITAGFNWYFSNKGHDFPVACFDARVFQVPKEEVVNYFIWRQQDASRNSVNMLGRFYFSHQTMKGKSNSDVQDMLMEQHNINWNDIAVWMKRGSCVVRKAVQIPVSMGIDHGKISADYVDRTILQEDNNIPVFTKDRDYIGRYLNVV